MLLKQSADYDEELKQLREEAKVLSQEESEYWRLTETFERVSVETERDASKINNLLEKARAKKEKLENFNSLSLLFKISTEGAIGKINGFALGCHPDKPVSLKLHSSFRAQKPTTP